MKTPTAFILKHGKPAVERVRVAPVKQPRSKKHSKQECLELISAKHPNLRVAHRGQGDFLMDKYDNVLNQIFSWTVLFTSLEV
jgi:hypothetical protein